MSGEDLHQLFLRIDHLSGTVDKLRMRIDTLESSSKEMQGRIAELVSNYSRLKLVGIALGSALVGAGVANIPLVVKIIAAL